MRKFRALLFCCLILVVGACKSGPSSHNKSLIELIRAGDLAGLKERFNKESVNSTDSEGQSLLHIATIENHDAIVEFLIAMGAEIDAVDNHGRTPLAVGLYRGSYNACEVLTKHDANIFKKDYDGFTPFSYSVENKIYKYALTKKTIKQADENGRTALHHAVTLSNIQLVDYILGLDKPSNTKDAQGKTPLALAYDNMDSAKSAEIAVKILLAGGKPLHGEFSQFETATLKRNFAMRFDDGNTPLHFAAIQGRKGIAEFLVKKKVPIDAKNIASSTPLHEAVRNGQIEMAIFLLSQGADPNARDSFGNTPLHLVMPEASRSELFERLLAAGANPNIKDNYGETPLHITARIGMTEDVIKKLIDSGADINERNKKGQTPLMLAVERKQVEQVRIFIDHGSNIHAEDITRATAFSRAINSDMTMVKMMINKNNINDRDSKGCTPLHIAIKENANKEVIEYLLAQEPIINTRDKEGNTPLHFAVENNNKALGEILLKHGADIFYTNVQGDSPLRLAFIKQGGREDWIVNPTTIKAKDGAGNTPLHLAAEWKTPSMITYLLNKGAKVDALNANNETALFNAVKVDSPECIEALVHSPRGRANLNARNFLGNSVLHTAVEWSAYKAADKVLELDSGESLIHAQNLAGKTALHTAARQGALEFINILTSYGVNINSSDEMGRSPLVDAVLKNQLNAVRLLLSKNASPVQQDMYGRTPLHEAVQTGNIDCIRLVQSAGGNPMARDTYGVTPLAIALQKNLKVLDVTSGNNPYLADSDGFTPLHVVAEEGAEKNKVKLLLNKQYPVNKRNRNGSTALLLAMQNNNTEIIESLLHAGSNTFITNNEGTSPLSYALTEKPEYLKIIVKATDGKTDTVGDGIMHYAARLGTLSSVTELLNMGYSKHVKNTAGETPYDVAMRWERPEIADLLKTGYAPKIETTTTKSETEIKSEDESKLESATETPESESAAESEDGTKSDEPETETPEAPEGETSETGL